MNATYHPVSIPEWTPNHRKLPAHTLCLSHVKDARGKRRCLAVPEREAAAYLVKLDRFAAEIAVVVKRHAAAEAARPKPKGKGPKRVKLPAFMGPTKLHCHQPGSPCLSPVISTEPDWYECKRPGVPGETWVGSPGRYVHVHRTRRGRKYLMAHMQGDSTCPTTIERKAREAAEAALAAQAAAIG